ncbi:MAG: LysM peptidoglycan-binding domain-containing protein [Rhodanobacter sp.]
MKMSTRCILPLTISFLLSACAGLPSQQASHRPTTVTPLAPSEVPAAVTPVVVTAPPPAENVWDRLRNSFVMPDCNADPSVVEWAKRYTHNPEVFEQGLRRALPRLVYVQQVAAQYRVPGEFVLLPWVESHYRSVPVRRHHPAGIWQIMPATGRSMGLRIDHDYDARLDMPAATDAVMKLLGRYHDRFHDWRVADYAYNAGEFRLHQLTHRQGAPADEPAIPEMPLHGATREHLVKLLAIACVVREPERFQVSLPILPAADRLVQTPVVHSMTMSRVAKLAGISVEALRQLNPASSKDRRDTAAAAYLMLPAQRADQLRAAMTASADPASGNHAASTTTASDRTLPYRHEKRTHVVTSGESLWQIARKYSTSVARLEQLNHLPGELAIQPGQVLQLDVVD